MIKSITKSANEKLILEFEFARALEYKWKPGRVYSLNAFVRPTVLNGFEYQATTAGQSGSREPRWPTTVDETVSDGSVVWTAVAFADNASDSISTQTVTSDAGLTIAGVTRDETRVLATVSAGTGTHKVVAKITTVTTAEIFEYAVNIVVDG
jgi:hypothetical protein